MTDPKLDDIILRAEFTSTAHERFKGGEPDDYLTEIHGTLLVEDEHGNKTLIGSMTAHYIDIANGNMNDAEHSIFDLFDCISDDYVVAFRAIFNSDGEEYWDEIEDAFALGFNVLVIDEVKLDRQDSDIAQRFLKLIVDDNAPGAGIVIAFKDSGLSEQVLHSVEFFRSPRIPSVFILNRGAPFQGALLKTPADHERDAAH